MLITSAAGYSSPTFVGLNISSSGPSTTVSNRVSGIKQAIFESYIYNSGSPPVFSKYCQFGIFNDGGGAATSSTSIGDDGAVEHILDSVEAAGEDGCESAFAAFFSFYLRCTFH